MENNQRSLGWFRARLGNVTGSRCGDLMKAGRRKDETFGETAKSYIMQLAAERMMNPAIVNDDELFAQYVECTSVTSKALRFGTEQEGAARKLFSKVAGVEVVEPSSCRHDTVPHFAASPDGLILGSDGKPLACVEIKCPNIDTFIRYTGIHDGASLKDINPQYYWQVQAEMSCTGTELCYFVAYSPWLLRPLHVAQIRRDAEDERRLLDRIIMANELIDILLNGKETANLPRIFDCLHKGAADAAVGLAQ